MKKPMKNIIALLLAVVLVAMTPLQAFAKRGPTAKYVSEVKIGIGKKAEDALASLQGYEILKDGSGNYVDLNKDAGGGVGSKGNRVVYLGFKRTDDRSEAITDLAVMNMKGGYSVKDYKALMEQYMSEQVIPFVDRFLVAVEEYRANYASSIPANRQRAQYIHDLLNELTDDDCRGDGLGDLLLNETKYELGDAAYEALTDSQKLYHPDLVTIVSQANGKATYLMANLLTRAADTNEDTWLERFTATTYEDLEDETGLSPSRAKAELSMRYEDDAKLILASWDELREELLGAEQDAAELDVTEVPDDSAIEEKVQAVEENYTVENMIVAVDAIIENNNESFDIADKICNVTVHDLLSSIEYEDGTLYDFFTQTYEDVEEDIYVLYPLVAALSDGQRAGLEFISLRELILIGGTDETGYEAASENGFAGGSIYDGVDREIYEPGGVALTSDAIRNDMAMQAGEDSSDSPLHWYNYALMGLAGLSAIGCAASTTYYFLANRSMNYSFNLLTGKFREGTNAYNAYMDRLKTSYKEFLAEDPNFTDLSENMWAQEKFNANKTFSSNKFERLAAKTPVAKWLSVGFSIATVVITAITLWLTFRDLKNYYKVDYTPIPRYIVDEKDITAFDADGNKIVVNNLAVYYKAVPCDRASDAEFYSVLGTIGDLNGDVGKQWLALYAERNVNSDPILADSFRISTSEQIPAGYEKGIHMFGSSAAENLNNPLYVWNSTAPKVYVYFKLDVGASTAGTSFTRGAVALSGAAGLVTGALAAALIMTGARKKKEKTVPA